MYLKALLKLNCTKFNFLSLAGSVSQLHFKELKGQKNVHKKGVQKKVTKKDYKK